MTDASSDPPLRSDGDGFWPTASLASLEQRAGLLRALRRFFDGRGYLEIETPLLSSDVCVDAWIDPFIVNNAPRDGSIARTMFLQTSPEFAMKRLLAAGCKAIYQVTRAFRRGENGPLHNSEFTIAEWYKVGDDVHRQMELVEQLVRHVASHAAGFHTADLPDSDLRPASLPPDAFRRITYDEAFEEFAGSRVLRATPRELRAVAARHGVSIPTSLNEEDRDGWLNLLLASVVEPALARRGAVFLYDYPHTQAALARIRDGDPPVAERFELYLNGIEICNGYLELTDAAELHARMTRQAGLRRAAGLADLPVESRLENAMRAGLPECAGVALGFDRLVMWCLGAGDIRQVTAFPFDRA